MHRTPQLSLLTAHSNLGASSLMSLSGTCTRFAAVCVADALWDPLLKSRLPHLCAAESASANRERTLRSSGRTARARGEEFNVEDLLEASFPPEHLVQRGRSKSFYMVRCAPYYALCVSSVFASTMH